MRGMEGTGGSRRDGREGGNRRDGRDLRAPGGAAGAVPVLRRPLVGAARSRSPRSGRRCGGAAPDPRLRALSQRLMLVTTGKALPLCSLRNNQARLLDKAQQFERNRSHSDNLSLCMRMLLVHGSGLQSCCLALFVLMICNIPLL